MELADSLAAIETKSGKTIADDFFDYLRAFAEATKGSRSGPKLRGFVIHGGAETQQRSVATALPWSSMDRHHARAGE